MLATLDLGTNTFHLLIATVNADGTLNEVYRERKFVKLKSQGGQTIGPEPYARGIAALRHFAAIIANHNANLVRALGTAAMRDASNGPEFRDAASDILGRPVEIISGAEEARLIAVGVKAALPPLKDRVLIMDIGGGSTEFIIMGPEGNDWSQSFPIGIASLTERFHTSDPLPLRQVEALRSFVHETFEPLSTALKDFPTRHLVGAAGSFEVLVDHFTADETPANTTSRRLELSGYKEMLAEITGMTSEERYADPRIPDQRADMIVAAWLLLDALLELADIKTLTVSDYAIKEGALLAAFGS